MTVSELGEPPVDVVFDDVIENGNSPFIGFELLAKDGYPNSGMSCSNFGEYIIKVTVLV